jgi:molybdate transport repressor ModE-like protein
MNSLIPRIRWERSRAAGGEPLALEERLVPLLQAIRERGSLTLAARALGIPYRSAWGILEDAHEVVGVPLVQSTRGRGGVLTPLGEQLLLADARARQALDARSGAVVVPLPERTATAVRQTLAIAASHDLALAQLRDAWRLHHGIALEFHGSDESLAAYVAGRVDLAGFHVPARATAADPLLAHLRPSRDARIRFLKREQGLILPAGNPKRVRALRDLVAKGVSFVNRQPGSGTRLLFDRLLAREGIDPAALAGYTREEFTHAAVAATVAAGNAGAGFGVRAAATQLGLAFVPLARERYFFACRRRELDSEPVLRFRALLASEATRAVVRPLPGYSLDAPGEPVEDAFRPRR